MRSFIVSVIAVATQAADLESWGGQGYGHNSHHGGHGHGYGVAAQDNSHYGGRDHAAGNRHYGGKKAYDGQARSSFDRGARRSGYG